MSGASLLDVNFLLALVWPTHTSHEAAHRWYARHAAGGWATCAMTQAGFVRLMANATVTGGSVSAGQAMEELDKCCRRSGHVFWPSDVEFSQAVELSGVKLQGHRQVTDLYLIGLAVKHKGRLVTFDKALGQLSKSVVVI
jgi:toxin-antitoxin system PIN domain toxin